MSIHAKLLEAQKSVEAVVKRGKNTGTGQGYSYATAADVIGVCREALHAAGLVGGVVEVSKLKREPITSSKGTAGMYAEVRVVLSVSDAGEPEDDLYPLPVTFEGRGAGIDYPGDKAIYKAQTGATKYAYANALALPFADHDPERDIPGEAGRAPAKKDPSGTIDADRVQAILDAFHEQKWTMKQIALGLGAVGADAQKANRKDSVAKAVRQLTPAQATDLEGALAGE